MKIPKSVAVIIVLAIALLLFDRHVSEKSVFSSLGTGTETTAISVSDPEPQDSSPADQSVSGSRSSAITRAVGRVSPAVVGISTQGTLRYRRPLYNDPLFRMFFPDEIYERQVSGLGSGFVISEDGYIITNDHVIEGADEITVTLTDKNKYSAAVINRDFASDIALLKIEGDNFPYIDLGNSDNIIVGEWVIALGNPFGLFEINDQPSVTVGVISAYGRDFGRYVNDRFYNDMIQTDASINPGNSGGPLVNGAGEVIGVNSFIVTGGSQQQGSIGIGFAIPVNKVKQVIEQLKATAGEDTSYYTGLRVVSINRMIQYQLGLRTREGALITRVDTGSPSDNAGLKVGDVFVEMNGRRVRSPDDMVEYLDRIGARPGMALSVKVIRDNSIIEISLTLARKS